MAEPAAAKQADRSTSAPVIYEARDGVSWITLNRPSVLNALDTVLAATLAECVERAAGDAATFVVVVRGAGRAFCSGMDRSALAAGAIDEPFYRHWIRALNLLEDMPKVAIAVLHGYSIGGGLQLAVACDLRLATSDAVLGLGASRHGIIPDGSVLRLAALLERLRHQAPTANGHIKRLLQASFHADPRALVEDVLRAQDDCMRSWETVEANRAWNEKREPVFHPPPARTSNRPPTA